MAALQDQIDAGNLWELEATVGVAMDALRCPPDDADVTTLSGGERRRVALCKLLLEKPDMLLLDEPTNHLDAESIAWLQKHLIDYKGTILIVTHDRYFLDDITGWILELDRGRGIPYEGNYSAWLDQKAKRMAQEAREDKIQAEGAGKGTGVDPLRCQGPSGQGQGPPLPLQRDGRPDRHRTRHHRADHHPERRTPGQQGDRGRRPEETHGRQASDRGPVLHRPAGRHRRRHRPERCGQVHPVPHDHRARDSRTRARSPWATR